MPYWRRTPDPPINTQTKEETPCRNPLYMSMSVDRFIAGPNEGPATGLATGHRLPEWASPDADNGPVVCGRGTFGPAGDWDGDPP